mgnify:CR=1 FL=1
MNPPNRQPFVLGSGLHDVPLDVGCICPVFGREEVANPRVGRCVDDLMYLSNSAEHCRRFANSVVFVFDGYNDDPRELVDIPQVRTLLAQLEAKWPYWAFFFNQVDDSIKLLLSCAAGSRFLGRGAVEMDAQCVATALAHGFGGMNEVFDRFGFPESELELMSRGLVEVLEQAGMA